MSTPRRKLEPRPPSWQPLTRVSVFGRARQSATVCLLALFLAVGLGPQPARAQSDVINREYPLKALFLYNFGSYVDWPSGVAASDADPFVIGILGTSAVELPLREIAAAQKVNGRPIVVERFGLTLAFVNDPDGYLIELGQRRTEQATPS